MHFYQGIDCPHKNIRKTDWGICSSLAYHLKKKCSRNWLLLCKTAKKIENRKINKLCYQSNKHNWEPNSYFIPTTAEYCFCQLMELSPWHKIIELKKQVLISVHIEVISLILLNYNRVKWEINRGKSIEIIYTHGSWTIHCWIIVSYWWNQGEKS